MLCILHLLLMEQQLCINIQFYKAPWNEGEGNGRLYHVWKTTLTLDGSEVCMST